MPNVRREMVVTAKQVDAEQQFVDLRDANCDKYLYKIDKAADAARDEVRRKNGGR